MGNKDINNFPFLSSVKRQEERPVLSWWWRFKLNFLQPSPYWRLKPNLREAWKEKSAISSRWRQTMRETLECS